MAKYLKYWIFLATVRKKIKIKKYAQNKNYIPLKKNLFVKLMNLMGSITSQY